MRRYLTVITMARSIFITACKSLAKVDSDELVNYDVLRTRDETTQGDLYFS